MKQLRFVMSFGFAALLGATIGPVIASRDIDLSPTFAAILLGLAVKLIAMVAATGAASAWLYSAVASRHHGSWSLSLAGIAYGIGSTIGAMNFQVSTQVLVPLLAVAALAVIALAEFAVSRKESVRDGAA